MPNNKSVKVKEELIKRYGAEQAEVILNLFKTGKKVAKETSPSAIYSKTSNKIDRT